MSRLILALAWLLIGSIAAHAQSGAQNVWTKDNSGWARHALSGRGCPPDLATRGGGGAAGSVALKDVIIGSERQPPGTQVGCEYEGAQGAWASVEIVRLRATEGAAPHAVAARNRIMSRYPSAQLSGRRGAKPVSPTGGETFTIVFRDIGIGGRTASIAVAGGDVNGWMVTLVQFDYDDTGDALQAVALSNWQTLAAPRR
jgi:hypothetical protein